jgi:virulence-associated protein VagC
MFTRRFKNLFRSDRVSCVKLPAAVAFPTDDRLLQRIEESRRALPANNMKPLWKSREPGSSPDAACELREPDVEKQLTIKRPVGACIVPLARAAGAHARARGGFSASAA